MNKGARLKAARLAARKTQEEVAKELHIAATTYKGWEADREPRTLDMTARLCKCLSISLDYYVTGEECAPPLSAEERQALDICTNLPPAVKQSFMGVMKSVATHLEETTDLQD